MNKTYAEKYPALDNLLCCYFNPDWNEDYATSEEVISGFSHSNGRSFVEQAIQELKTLLKEIHTFEEWESILYDSFGCEYYFDYEEQYTPKEWFEKVLKQLEEELSLTKGD